MTLRIADSRFLLPREMRAATLYGAPDWRLPLETLGVEICDSASAPAAEAVGVVGTSSGLRPAIAAGHRDLLLHGRLPWRSLISCGYAVQRYAAIPRLNAPVVLVPLGESDPADHALERWLAPASFRKLVRNRTLAGLLGRGAAPPGVPTVTVASRQPGPALLIQAFHDAGVRADSLYLGLSGTDDLSRAVAVAFVEGNDEPTHVLKLVRAADLSDPLDRDAAGLALLGSLDDDLLRNVPRLLTRTRIGRHHAAIETAGHGGSLSAYLRGGARQSTKLRLIDRIAGWLIRMAAQTIRAPSMQEFQRLQNEVLPEWTDRTENPLPATLGQLPSVVQHADPGCWNILTDGREFTIVDWESARPDGLPLWDVVYFLTDAFGHLARVPDGAAWRRHAAVLHSGGSRFSAGFFRKVLEAAAAGNVPRDLVGTLVTLNWLHHGLSARQRADALRSIHGAATARSAAVPDFAGLATDWVTDPDLGFGWPALHRYLGGSAVSEQLVQSSPDDI